MSAKKSTERIRLIKLLHVAKRELQMDDSSYRTLILLLTGKSTSADMSIIELNRVLDSLKQKGFNIRVRSVISKRKLADDAQSKMIRGLWLELANIGEVSDRSEGALAAFVKRITKVDALQWLSTAQASNVIEALKDWLKRADANTRRLTNEPKQF